MAGLKLGYEVGGFYRVPLEQIRTSPIALRAVDKESEKYNDMVTDVGKRGVLKPVTVRIKEDLETGDEYLELVDGLHRFSSGTDAGVETIPVSVLSLTDAEVEETQLALNIIQVETKPMEVAQQLRRMLTRNPTMTTKELGDMISKSETYVIGHLGLNKLEDSIKKMVVAGDLNSSNAIQLAKLPKTEQHDFLVAAQKEEVAVFVKTVKARLSKIRTDAKAGKPTTGPSYQAVAHVRKLKEIEAVNVDVLISGSTTPQEAANRVIAWVKGLDEATQAAKKAEWEANEAAKADQKKKDAAITAEKKLREAREKALKARSESGLSDEEIEKSLEAADADAAVAVAEADGDDELESQNFDELDADDTTSA
jgi:ParB/RepB/Spo0J family partition protein